MVVVPAELIHLPSYSAPMLLTLFSHRRHSQSGCGELYGSGGAAEVEGEMLAISLSFYAATSK